MPEVAVASEDHRHAFVVRGLDDLGVAHGSTGLDRSGGASLGGGDESVGEWEKGVTANDAAFERKARSWAFQTAMREASTRDIWPAPIPSVRSAAA